MYKKEVISMYLPETNNVTFKNNVASLIDTKEIDLDELLEDLEISQDELESRLNPHSKRELTPNMYYRIHVYLLKKDLDYENLLGDLPETYGERLKFFIYGHYMTMSEFSRKTGIPSSTLFNMYSNNINISSKYKKKMCNVLTENEFSKLSPFTDVDLDIERDQAVIDGMNFSYNLYKIKPSFFNPERLMKVLNIHNINMDEFYVGKVKITPARKKKIAEYMKVSVDELENLTNDSLELSNPLNKFGYWFALQLYNMSNPIPVFASRCNLDPQYIIDILSGQTIIKDCDVKNIANHLEVEKEALYNIMPHTDEELLPMKPEKKERKEKKSMATAKKKTAYNKDICNIIHNKLHMSVQDFCGLVDVNYFTFMAAINRGSLPEKNRKVIIKELGLNEDMSIPTVKEEAVKENPKPKSRRGGKKEKRVDGLNSLVRSKLKEEGLSINEFCKTINVAPSSFCTAIRRDYLPRGYEDVIVSKLHIEKEYYGKQSVEEQIKEDIEDNQCNPVPITRLDPDSLEPNTKEGYTLYKAKMKPSYKISFKPSAEQPDDNYKSNILESINILESLVKQDDAKKDINLSDEDKINILEMFNRIDSHEQQISLIRLFCKLSNLEVNEELERKDIIGFAARVAALMYIMK
jgi:transcriptional regulator with XRE-family HTH domain